MLGAGRQWVEGEGREAGAAFQGARGFNGWAPLCSREGRQAVALFC